MCVQNEWVRWWEVPLSPLCSEVCDAISSVCACVCVRVCSFSGLHLLHRNCGGIWFHVWCHVSLYSSHSKAVTHTHTSTLKTSTRISGGDPPELNTCRLAASSNQSQSAVGHSRPLQRAPQVSNSCRRVGFTNRRGIRSIFQWRSSSWGGEPRLAAAPGALKTNTPAKKGYGSTTFPLTRLSTSRLNLRSPHPPSETQ